MKNFNIISQIKEIQSRREYSNFPFRFSAKFYPIFAIIDAESNLTPVKAPGSSMKKKREELEKAAKLILARQERNSSLKLDSM